MFVSVLTLLLSSLDSALSKQMGHLHNGNRLCYLSDERVHLFQMFMSVPKASRDCMNTAKLCTIERLEEETLIGMLLLTFQESQNLQ